MIPTILIVWEIKRGYMKEDRTVEFKERMTDTFLKTVSAYVNYDRGSNTRYSLKRCNYEISSSQG